MKESTFENGTEAGRKIRKECPSRLTHPAEMECLTTTEQYTATTTRPREGERRGEDRREDNNISSI